MTLYNRKSPRRRPKRRWFSIVMTTVVLVLAYASFLIGLGGIGREEADVAGAALGTGIALTPLTFGVAAFVSIRPRPVLGTLMALGAWVAALPITIFDVMVGMVAAYAVGVAVALRMPDGARWVHRGIAIVALTAAAAIGVLIEPAAVVLTLPLITAPAIAFADDIARGFPPPEAQSTT